MKKIILSFSLIFFVCGCASTQQSQAGANDTSGYLDLLQMGLCLMSGSSPYFTQNVSNCSR